MPLSAATIEHACRLHFHQHFTLPATSTHGALRITYSIAGKGVYDTANHDVPTLLFMGGMFGGRVMAWGFHHLAEQMGIRVVVVDRPGMGSSTGVPLTQRIPVWLETVPALLDHLGIKHVALGAHSSGTMFLLNTLMAHSRYLHPQRPYVAVMAPWVHQSHSGVGIMRAASMIPTPMFGAWNGLTKAIVKGVVPSIAWSSGVLGAMQNKKVSAETQAQYLKTTGASFEAADELSELIVEYAFAEDTTGGNDEALLCLKKGEEGMWAAADDYEAFVRVLSDKVNAEGDAPRSRLRVQAFFSESDDLVGKGGQKYFEDCWRRERLGHAIHFDSFVVQGTTHDTVCQPIFGAVGTLFQSVKESFEGGGSG